MASKRITIDAEAYDRLKAHMRENASFSQTIKRLVKPPFDVDEYLKRIRANPMSKEAAEAVEECVRRRRDPRNLVG